MICPTCSAENRDGARFCDECGARLAEPSATREQRKVVTVLFCDVTGSTALAERLDPESLRVILARYFERMKAIVERHGGTVEKFIGDAVMAVFGVPVVHEDDALRALRAAGEMRRAFPELGIEGRIGVMSGEVVTGTEERLATGDAVNVAARLEQAAHPGEILIGGPTYDLARDAVEVEPVEPPELTGKTRPVTVYRLVAVHGGEGVSRRLDAPMVGRETEMRRLRDAFDQAARDGSCQLFTILGTAGVGKSRLAAEFVASLRGATLARGRCLPYGEGITYWPVVEVVKQLLPAKLDASAERAIRSLLGDETPVASAPEIARAFRKLLESAAAERPLVCVFDDLHWGEDTFLDLVEHVADLSREAPIVLLCVARPDLLDRRSTWGGGKLNATTVLLEPLDARDAGRLIESLGDLAAPLRDRIRDAAEGNPLFLEQMVALVRDSGDGEIVVPPTIHALLAARIDQLEPAERDVLEAGSVEGRLFHRGAVQALAPTEEVTGRLTALVRKELVRPDRAQIPGDDAFRFRHLLIRDAAYEALPKAVRADLHALFADWLEVHGRDLVELEEILGYHLEQAARYHAELGSPDELLARRAGEHLAAAGRRALARQDAAAPGLLERAVELLPDGQFDAPTEIDLADALFAAGRPRESVECMESLAARAAARQDTGAELKARLVRLCALVFTDPEGRTAELRPLVDEARPVFEAADDVLGLYLVAYAEALLAHERMLSSSKLVAVELGIACARRLADERREREMMGEAVSARTMGTTSAAEMLAWIEEQERAGVDHPGLLYLRAYALSLAGRFEEARAARLSHGRYFEELGLAVPVVVSDNLAWSIEMAAGDLAAAERIGRDVCERLEAMGERSWLSTIAGQLALTLYELGRDDEAETWSRRSEELGASDDVATQAIWRQARARILARRGETAEAEPLAREAVALLAATDNITMQGHALVTLSVVLAAAGNTDEATEAGLEALALFERKGDAAMAERLRAKLDRPAVA